MRKSNVISIKTLLQIELSTFNVFISSAIILLMIKFTAKCYIKNSIKNQNGETIELNTDYEKLRRITKNFFLKCRNEIKKQNGEMQMKKI
jgi:hypothetical protein